MVILLINAQALILVQSVSSESSKRTIALLVSHLGELFGMESGANKLIQDCHVSSAPTDPLLKEIHIRLLGKQEALILKPRKVSNSYLICLTLHSTV